jgi:hypothetical protein
MMMMHDVMGGGMMWGMGLLWLVALVVLLCAQQPLSNTFGRDARIRSGARASAWVDWEWLTRSASLTYMRASSKTPRNAARLSGSASHR